MRHRLAGATALLCLAATAWAAQPQFWELEGARDFLEGDTEGLSIDSVGRVRLGPATRTLADTEAPFVWALATDGARVYAGTGNDGKVFRIEDGKSALFYDAPELEVHALATGRDGRLYVGTSPDGKVYAVDRAGKAEVFFDPAEKYVWAIAFDREGRLLVATGNDGKVYRVDAKGKSEVLFSSPEAHITALATDAAGNVYAGSAPGGVIYRIDASGKVFVLDDSAYREVKALDVGPDGALYAALIEGKEGKEERPQPLVFPAATAASSAPVGEVTVTESFSLAPSGAAPPAAPPTPRPSAPARTGAPKGAVLRISPSGEVDTLWSSAEEMPHALVATSDGVLVGTGDKGKLYRIRDDRTWAMVSAFAAEQVTSLARGAGGAVFLATSNAGKVYAVLSGPGTKGVFTSKPKDTDTVSSWGRVRWEASVPAGAEIQVQTRSGNTANPDRTWSAWSAPYAAQDGTPIASPSARFLQVRLTLVGKEGRSPLLDNVVAAYLQKNLRPQVQTVTVHPPGEVFQKPISLSGEVEILGLDEPRNPEGRPGPANRSGLPPVTAYSRKLYQKGIQTLSWKADDPNGDTLAYDVFYRPVADDRYRPLRKGLTDAVLAWDTTTVPNGRYVVKVVASDAPGNPAADALAGDKESAPFDVDNTPPTVTVTLAQKAPARVHVVVKDDASVLRKAEYSVDGGRWLEVHPVDGINDSLEETYDFAVGELTGPGPHVVVVRASDLLGNLATGRVELP